MKLIITVLLFFVFLSCKEKQNEIFNPNQGKYFKGEIEIILDSVSTYEIYKFQVVNENSTEKLYTFNEVVKSLDVFDLNNGSLVERINLNIDDKFGGFAPYSFYIHNKDSIYIFQQYSFNKIVLIDSNEKIINIIKENLVENKKPTILNHVSNLSNPTYLIRNKFFATNWSFNNTFSMEGLDPRYNSQVIFDLDKGEANQVLNTGYPISIKNKRLPVLLTLPFRTWNQDNTWVFSWPTEDSIFIYNSDFTIKKSKLAKSEYSTDFNSFDGNNSSENKFFLEKTNYNRIIFDKYRNKYYRIVQIGRPIENGINPNLEEFHLNKFSIIVLDENFEVLNEINFPPRQYNPYQLFVAEKGIYIPKTNIYYDGLSDEKINIDIFEF